MFPHDRLALFRNATKFMRVLWCGSRGDFQMAALGAASIDGLATCLSFPGVGWRFSHSDYHGCRATVRCHPPDCLLPWRMSTTKGFHALPSLATRPKCNGHALQPARLPRLHHSPPISSRWLADTSKNSGLIWLWLLLLDLFVIWGEGAAASKRGQMIPREQPG